MTEQSLTIQRAQKEGKVNVYGTVEPEDFSGWKESFERKYSSIEIEYKREYLYGTPPPMALRIMDEVKHDEETADVVIAATPLMMQMKELNLLSRTKLREDPAYPKVRRPDGYWAPLLLLPMIQVYNPKSVSKKDLPVRVLDLTAAKWKETIVSHDVRLGTLGAYWLASLRPMLGERKWWKLVAGLAKNRPRFYPLFDDVVDLISRGEARIGLTVLLHDYLKAKEAGRDIERLRLEDLPMLISFSGIARTRAGRHPAAAELLLDFLISDEGQKEVGRTYLRIPARPHIDAPYSLDNLAPREKHTVFPNTDMLHTIDDSISAFVKLFGKGKAS